VKLENFYDTKIKTSPCFFLVLKKYISRWHPGGKQKKTRKVGFFSPQQKVDSPRIRTWFSKGRGGSNTNGRILLHELVRHSANGCGMVPVQQTPPELPTQQVPVSANLCPAQTSKPSSWGNI